MLWLLLQALFIINIQAQGDGCVLRVPNNPLTPQGLMTPWVLMGTDCSQANPLHSRFVHAVILNTVTGEMMVYNPLVVSQGMNIVSQPAPVNFTLATSVVGIWLGSNSNFLTLTFTNGNNPGNCVTGPQDSPFGQFGWCNANNFWPAVNNLVQQGLIVLPPLGSASDGLPCPTLRDFFIVDMDPDDGVQSLYLVTSQNQVVQNTRINAKNFNIVSTLANDGDNRLISELVNPAIGCQSMVLPNAADPGTFVAALPMNVLQAMMYQKAPVALTPNNDPMVVNVNTNLPDLNKLNLYRMGVNQPQAAVLGGDNDPVAYCRNYGTIAPPRFKSLGPNLKTRVSPAPGFATLFDFMKNRASTTWKNLNCAQITGQADPFVNIN